MSHLSNVDTLWAPVPYLAFNITLAVSGLAQLKL